jgi:hypothetical protein
VWRLGRSHWPSNVQQSMEPVPFSPLRAHFSARCLLASGLSKGPSTGGALEHGQRPRRVKDGIDGMGGRHGLQHGSAYGGFSLDSGKEWTDGGVTRAVRKACWRTEGQFGASLPKA